MTTQISKWQCRIAPSLGGGFAGTPNQVWGTDDYTDDQRPTVFFGMYGLPDFYAVWRHKGEKHILWAGSDLRHLKGNYWLDDKGEIRIDNKGMCEWINKNCTSWVENKVEHNALKELGIESTIVPSFLGNVDDFPVQELNQKKRYYSSVSGDDFILYGWDKIGTIAQENPEIEYHLYGSSKNQTELMKELRPFPDNVILHGRVSQQQMDSETKSMTGAIRLLEFEGFSEIVAKSILWGQKPISLIDYPFLREENPREELLKVLNKYEWNTK